jgi:hypothetical protein
MNPRLQTPTHLPPISSRLLFGVGGLATSFAVLVLATALGAGKAEGTVAFQKDTGRPCSACHATPGTNMRNFTSLGTCFKNSGYDIAACQARPRPSPGTGTTTGQNCRTRTVTVEIGGRTITRKETVCQ